MKPPKYHWPLSEEPAANQSPSMLPSLDSRCYKKLIPPQLTWKLKLWVIERKLINKLLGPWFVRFFYVIVCFMYLKFFWLMYTTSWWYLYLVENLLLPVWSASILVQGSFALSNILYNSNIAIITFFCLLFSYHIFFISNFQLFKILFFLQWVSSRQYSIDIFKNNMFGTHHILLIK